MSRKLLRLIGGEGVKLDSQWQILDGLYEIKHLVVATGAILYAATIAWQYGLRIGPTLWLGSSIIVVIARSGLARAYYARSRSSSPKRWIRNFFIASTITGVQWGLGGLVLLETSDCTVVCAVFAVYTSLVAGAVIRSHCYPVAAISQVTSAGAVMLILSLIAGQWVFVAPVILYALYQVYLIKTLGGISLRQIRSDQDRARLLVSLRSANDELKFANAQLEKISLTDPLTGVANRRGFDAELRLHWQKAVQTRSAMALLLIDVDHFKHFNDIHGHPAGDACLVLIAKAIVTMAIHPQAHVSRYGGEEFAVILPEADVVRASDVAQAIVLGVRSIGMPLPDGATTGVTVSIGVALVIPEPTSGSHTILSVADKALYRAKQDGRDCIRVGEAVLDGVMSL
jgi:diguanylate cyclase (GGDEF)-like protein